MKTDHPTPIELNDSERRQRELAYQIWEDEGRPEGKADEHWSRAGLMLLDLEMQNAQEPIPVWLRRSGMEPLSKQEEERAEGDDTRGLIRQQVA